MKTAALMIMLVALYLLYRIAFPPKPTETKKSDAPPRKKETDVSQVVVKSRFIRPNAGLLQTTHSSDLKADSQEENQHIFASGNEKKGAVIPSERLNEVFGEEPNPEELDILPDEEEEAEVTDLEEEAEDLWQTLGRDAELAAGLSIEEMTEAAEAIKTPVDEKGGLLYRVEGTDMFEKLVCGDEGKAARIREVIERHLGSRGGEGRNEGEGWDGRDRWDNGGNKKDDNNDWKNFNMQEFLG